jgi:hypothetical protein
MTSLCKHISRLTCLLLFFTTPLTVGASDARQEARNQIYAAYLFNFAKFTQFSNIHQSTINICVFGQGGINNYILTANQQFVGSNQVRVLIYPQFESNLNYKHCQFSYINDERDVQKRQIVAYFSKTHALLFSALPKFIKHGGHIQFTEINDRVSFYFLASVISQHPYKISSQVLALGQQAHE